jgi:hypothetical protein
VLVLSLVLLVQIHLLVMLLSSVPLVDLTVPLVLLLLLLVFVELVLLDML